MLLNDTRISSNPEPNMIMRRPGTEDNPQAPEGYSDAIDRSRFLRTSIHIPGVSFTLQVSNKRQPDQSTDTDWVDIATTTTGFIDTDLAAKYFRVKLASGTTLADDTQLYIMSIYAKY